MSGERTEAELEMAAARLLEAAGLDDDTYWASGGQRWVVGKDDSWHWMVRGRGYGGHATAIAAAMDLLCHHPELWPKEPPPAFRAETVAGLVQAALDQDGRSAFRVSMDAGKSRGCLHNALKRDMQPYSASRWLWHITGKDYAIAQGAGWALAMPEGVMLAALSL